MWCACCDANGKPEEVVSAVNTTTEETKEEEIQQVLHVDPPKEAAKPADLKPMVVQEEKPKISAPPVAAAPEEKTAPPAPAAAPEIAPMTTFIVNVSKEGGKLGAGLDTSQDDCCVVRRVDAGSTLEKQRVKLYDRLVAVNGKHDKSSELVKILAANSTLALKFERPKIEEVKIEKAGRKVGLKLGKEDACTGLVVKEVTGGLAGELPKDTFVSGARIVEINGKMGTASELVDMLSANDSLAVKVCTWNLSA
mmetsp:Transcript_12990/g.24564  ORF Transcript_12990/g.24564 Transcript_12990/m.24564 type:complete len:252 (+) Transcript_12990:46-801(+)